MTLLLSLGSLFGSAVFALLLTGAGALILRQLKIETSGGESLLHSLACGAILLELCVTAGELARDPRTGVRAGVAFACVLGLFGITRAARTLSQAIEQIRLLPRLDKFLAGALGCILFIEGLAAMAPLTGSDALHYHFTLPAQILREGFHANWFDPHSFFLGQSHQLILAGLALGSDRLALGIIFIGGAAAALSIVVLAREWMGGALPWVAAITFALTPVCFWQITASGAPDVWMALLLPLTALAVIRAARTRAAGYAALAGIYAGGIAGAKYTGAIFALVLACVFLAESRSLLRFSLFSASAVCTGVWPYARNWFWTRDPVFPFFVERFGLAHVNQYAVSSLLADTGAGAAHRFWALLQFPFFSAIDPAHLGFWQMLGPVVLCCAPLLLFAPKNTLPWRVALIVWIGGSLGIGVTSGMTRFTLPVYPIALAAVFAGVETLRNSNMRFARLVLAAILIGYLGIGLAGLLVYTRPALAPATGLQSREDYLRERAPDYSRTEFLNERLSGARDGGKVLVTFSHTYYLRIPFISGMEQENWFLDPALLPSGADLAQFLRRENIRWVLKEGEYPPRLQQQYEELESQHVLVPCGSGVARDFSGNRINETRTAQSLTLLCVQ